MIISDYCCRFLISSNRKDRPKNLSLDCKRIDIRDACTQRVEESTDWVNILLIIASVTFFVLLTIQLLIFYLMKEETITSTKGIEKPLLQMNRERVIGNTKPLAQFAGKYERNEENKTGLARKRTLK